MDNPSNNNITRHEGSVARQHREQVLGQKGCLVWLTGLSGSGKSTIAREVERSLTASGRLLYVLDGDNIRTGLSSDLDFSPAGRRENIRRIAEIAPLFVDAGIITITAFISPYRRDRDNARQKTPPGTFVETYVAAALDTCMNRDPKGLYDKARRGEIRDMTGIDAPYEPPEDPELTIPAGDETPARSAARIIAYLDIHGFLNPPA